MKVYAMVDQRGRVLSIRPENEVAIPAKYILIDEGDGERYENAYEKYMPKPLLVFPTATPKYKLVEGVVTERTEEEISADIAALPPPPPTTEEKIQAAESKLTAMKPLINDLLIGKPPEVVLPMVSMMDEWHEGKWTAGRSLTHQEYPYKVVQTHDSTGNPTWTPDATPALFAPWHGVSRKTALLWKAPTGAHNIYKVNEYMVFTDGKTYKCLQDTAYSPADYAQAWEAIYE